MLVRLQKPFREMGIPIVFVSVDSEETRAKALAFARKEGFLGTVLFTSGSIAEFKAEVHPEWPGMLPASFLFDSSGKMRFFWGGPAYESELTPIVSALSRGEPVQGEKRFDIVPGATGP
jgi:peroxiredoxin